MVAAFFKSIGALLLKYSYYELIIVSPSEVISQLFWSSIILITHCPQKAHIKGNRKRSKTEKLQLAPSTMKQIADPSTMKMKQE